MIDLKRDDGSVHEATFQVDVLLDSSAISDFFKERFVYIYVFIAEVLLMIRWGEYTISRPSNDQHLAKLLRRLKSFLSESFVEKRDSHDGWKVCLEKIIWIKLSRFIDFDSVFLDGCSQHLFGSWSWDSNIVPRRVACISADKYMCVGSPMSQGSCVI